MNRKGRNDIITAAWKKELATWEIEQDQAKAEKRKPGWTKPKRGELEKASPRPKVSETPRDDGGDKSEDEDDNDE